MDGACLSQTNRVYSKAAEINACVSEATVRSKMFSNFLKKLIYLSNVCDFLAIATIKEPEYFSYEPPPFLTIFLRLLVIQKAVMVFLSSAG